MDEDLADSEAIRQRAGMLRSGAVGIGVGVLALLMVKLATSLREARHLRTIDPMLSEQRDGGHTPEAPRLLSVNTARASR